MLVTFGGRFGGYGLYVLKGKPVFTYTCSPSNDSVGKVRKRSRRANTHWVFDFTYEGPGIAKGGAGVLKVTARNRQPKDCAHRLVPHAGGTKPLSRRGYPHPAWTIGITRCRFRFTGRIGKLTFKLGPPQLMAADKKAAAEAIAKARD